MSEKDYGKYIIRKPIREAGGHYLLSDRQRDNPGRRCPPDRDQTVGVLACRRGLDSHGSRMGVGLAHEAFNSSRFGREGTDDGWHAPRGLFPEYLPDRRSLLGRDAR